MKVLFNTNQPSYRASGNDLSFINNIRDRDVSILENLNKQKIETLLKFREAKKLVEMYQDILNKYSFENVSADIINKAKTDLEDMKTFKGILQDKLREINLAILKEEEKNY